MKILIKKIYIILFLLFLSLVESNVSAKDNKIQYTRENIANYFFGIISANQDHNSEAFRYLKNIKSLKNKHSRFNIEYIRTLILLGKFKQAFVFSKTVWKENELFFEADLLLGLDSFIKKDYVKAKGHFERLEKTSGYNFFIENFIGNVLIAWTEAAQGSKKDSLKYLEKIPKPYSHLTKIQNIFLQCFLIPKIQRNLLKN